MTDDITIQILKRLDSHSERLNKHEAVFKDLTKIAADVAATRSTAERNAKTLFGNGDPGMDERIRNMERSIVELTKKMDTFINVFRWGGGVAGAYVLVEVVKVLLSHL